MNLNRRLRTLEAAAQEARLMSARCSACGHGAADQLKYRIVLAGINDADVAPGPETCPECGRRLRYELHFVD